MFLSSLRDRLLTVAAKAEAHRVLVRVMRESRDARTTQDKLLFRYLRANADGDFGRQHGFSTISSYADYCDRVPIRGYEQLAPWIDRVRRGELSTLFGGGQRVRLFAMTSGTVDRPKFIPITDAALKELRAGWHAFGLRALMDHPDCFGRSILQVTSSMREQRAPSGVWCGAITGLMAETQKRLVRRFYAAPADVAEIPDASARRYAIMRLAMARDVSWIVTASPATVLQLARIGDERAEDIIRDIRDGTLHAGVAIPDRVRARLLKAIRPMPDRAAELERQADRTGRLLPKDYWRLGFLANWTGGTMGLYLHRYPEYFGDTPVRDIGLLATEGRMSIPVTDGTAAGLAAVSFAFLEFVPAGEYGRPKPIALRCHELEIGAEYFVLLTTSCGLYRYDIGDCVRVVGYEGTSPLIEFLHKGAHVSSMTGEKLTERQVVLALERAVAGSGMESVEFVLAPRFGDPPAYRLYAEAPGDRAREIAALGGRVDRALVSINVEYASKRSSGRLGPIEAAVLPPGSIHAINEVQARRFRASGNEQFKHRYLLTLPGEDAELAGRTASSRGRVKTAHGASGGEGDGGKTIDDGPQREAGSATIATRDETGV